MHISRKLNALLMAVSLVGLSAIATGFAFGTGLVPPARAAAASATISAQALGIGERTTQPDGLDTAAHEKFASADETASQALSRTIARRPAPIVAPPAFSRVDASIGRATVGGSWQSARASWYGPGFYGRRTASGAVLTQGMMNVAHRSMAFGTRIQFEYSGRTCIAVVNDRGPFVGGRTFDLGPGTAQALGFSGVGTVRYRILGR